MASIRTFRLAFPENKASKAKLVHEVTNLDMK